MFLILDSGPAVPSSKDVSSLRDLPQQHASIILSLGDRDLSN